MNCFLNYSELLIKSTTRDRPYIERSFTLGQICLIFAWRDRIYIEMALYREALNRESFTPRETLYREALYREDLTSSEICWKRRLDLTQKTFYEEFSVNDVTVSNSQLHSSFLGKSSSHESLLESVISHYIKFEDWNSPHFHANKKNKKKFPPRPPPHSS